MNEQPFFNTVRRFAFLLWPVLMTVNPAHGDALAGKDLVAALHAGGYVILMRHASSPRTAPDAAQVDADNVQHERQLDEEGRSSARDMGDALRRLQIPIGQVLSSPTYRALETIKFARLGQPTTFEQLGDSGQSMMADKSGARANWLKAKSAERPAPGKNTVIVTHFPNIKEAYPESVAGLADGEALILQPDGRGGVQVVARVKMDEWAALATIR
jgi:phosphohistidine phosphatase SixA